jgi:hypothetical protein
MSYNFGEIIKKLYTLFQEAKPSRHSRLPPPPSSQVAMEDEDGQLCSAPLLFRQDLPNSYWQLLASFGEFI